MIKFTYINQQIVPLIDIAIECMRLWFLTVFEKEFPELLVLFSLVDYFDF